MRIRNLIFIFLILTACNQTKNLTYENEVLFFANSEDIEVQSDYDYHISSLFDTYNDGKLKLTRLKTRSYDKGEISINIDSTLDFALILIDKNGKYKVHDKFGTDIDLMMIINEYFKNK